MAALFLEIPLESILTEEIKTLLATRNLKPVGVGLIVEPDSPHRNRHVVELGDTLSSIARKYNTTVAKLVEINQLQNPDLIKVGQIILY